MRTMVLHRIKALLREIWLYGLQPSLRLGLLSLFLGLLALIAFLQPGTAQLSRLDLTPRQMALQVKAARPLVTAPCASEIPDQLVAGFVSPDRALPAYQPRQIVTSADPSNFGERVVRDVSGRVVYNEPIIVLHETVGSLYSAIGLFQTYHPDDDDQVSYHTLIGADGTIAYVVPPNKRAYGAGNSQFRD